MVRTRMGIRARRSATLILLIIFLIMVATKCKSQVSVIRERLHFDDDAAHFHAAFWPTFLTVRYLDKKYDRRIIKSKHHTRRIYLTATAIGLGLTAGKEVIWDLLLKKGVPSWKDGGFGSYGTGVGLIVGLCDADYRKCRREEKLNRAKNIFE